MKQSFLCFADNNNNNRYEYKKSSNKNKKNNMLSLTSKNPICENTFDKNAIWIRQKRPAAKLTQLANDLDTWDSLPPIKIDLNDPNIVIDPNLIIDLKTHKNYFSFEVQDYFLNNNLSTSFPYSFINVNEYVNFDFKNHNKMKQGDTENNNNNSNLNLLVNLRQRSDWWFEQRINRVTGSKLTNIFGFWDLARLWITWFQTYDPNNKILEEVIKSQDESERERAKSQECMAWGTDHEDDGIATALHYLSLEGKQRKVQVNIYETTITPIKWSAQHLQKIKEYLLKDFKYIWQDGHDDEIWQNAFVADTPDFLGYEIDLNLNLDSDDLIENDNHNKNRNKNNIIYFAGEVKCAYGLRHPKIYENVPYWYYAQAQLHMLVRPDIEFCYFISWSPTKTRIWKINKDITFWDLALRPMVYFHKFYLDKKPPKSFVDSRFCEKLKEYCKIRCEMAILIGEFPSCFAKK
jgi:hypothetical protein